MAPNWIRRGVVVLVGLAVGVGVAGAVVVAAANEGLRVTLSGVGTGIEDRALVGEGTSFPEGRPVVFFTRVEGGSSGDAVDHVWIRDGREVVTVGLTVGGSPWRTWSRKEMRAGDAGPWTVEARDASGRVLATATFACTPAGG